jgi:hypothetical protein
VTILPPSSRTSHRRFSSCSWQRNSRQRPHGAPGVPFENTATRRTIRFSPAVTIAAAILVLAPEYLRAFSEYRMLLFGAVMVIMMIYRPQGLISGEKRTYKITNKDKIDSSKSAFDVPATGGQA